MRLMIPVSNCFLTETAELPQNFEKEDVRQEGKRGKEKRQWGERLSG